MNAELLLAHQTSYFEFWKPSTPPACESKQGLSSVLHQAEVCFCVERYNIPLNHITFCVLYFICNWYFTTCQLHNRRYGFVNVLWHSVTHSYFSSDSNVKNRYIPREMHFSSQYSHAPLNDVSVNNGMHLGWWSRKIIIL